MTAKVSALRGMRRLLSHSTKRPAHTYRFAFRTSALRRLLLVAALSACTSQAAHAQFARVQLGARSLGTGGSLVAAAKDASAAFWNPALLREVRQPNFLFDLRTTHDLHALAASAFDPQRGAVGIAIWQNENDPGRKAAAAAWAHSLVPHLNYGVLLAFSTVDTLQQYTYGVGLSWSPTIAPDLPPWLARINRSVLQAVESIRIGAAYVGLPLGRSAIRREFRLGISVQPLSEGPFLHLAQHWSGLGSVGYVGIEIPLTGENTFYLGAEGWNVRRLGLGVHLHWQQLHLDVGYAARSRRLIATFAFAVGERPRVMAEHHFTQGAKLAQKKDWRGALRELDRAVAFAPDDPRAWQLHATVHQHVKREDAELDSLFRHAEALRQRGDFVTAALEFSRILERNPGHQAAKQKLSVLKPAVDATVRKAFQLGVKLYDQEEYQKARDIFERVLLINPNHQQARDYLERTKAILHTFAEDHFLRGLGFYRQRNLTRAYEEFAQAVQLDPSYEEARKYFEQVSNEKRDLEKMLGRLLREGEELAHKGNAIQASIKFRKVLEVDAGNRVAREKLLELQPQVDAYIQRKLEEGKRALASGKLKAARAAFREVLRIVPTHQEASEYEQRTYNRMVRLADQHYQDGLAEFEDGNYERALREFERALLYLPTHAGAKRMRRQTFSMIGLRELTQKAKESYAQGDYVRAMAMFTQILESDPDNATALQYVERCQQRLNELAESHFNRGISLYAAEDYVAAIEEMEKALELNPNHRGAKEYKRRAESRLRALRSLR